MPPGDAAEAVSGAPTAGNATIWSVGVFKRLGPTHVHVRTPIMIGLIILLVMLGSAVCYYRVGTF